VEKLVFTSTPPEVTWPHSTPVNGDLIDVITEIKGRPGGDIGIHGSIALTQAVLAVGLVDELRLVIAPSLQGHGRKLFDPPTSTRLTLVRSVTSPAGSLLLDYLVEH
jgi:dihydrofolate reductase